MRCWWPPSSRAISTRYAGSTTWWRKQRRFTVRSWHVYYLQNSHANDVAYVLQQAFTPRNVTATPPGAGQTAPGQGQRQLGGGSGQSGGLGQSIGGQSAGSSGGLGGGGGQSGGGLSGGGLGGGGNGVGSLGGGGGSGGLSGGGLSGGGGLGGGGQAGGGGAASNPLLGGLDTSGGSGGGGDVDANTMRIIPNVQNNAVLVYATPQEETTLVAMLRKIDILPLQVRIDATIAEVTLNDTLKYGTQFFFKEGSINQTLTNATGGIVTGSAAGATAGGFPGFVVNAAASGVNATISALQNVTTVNVLSSPELLVVDNQPARLQVGSLVPLPDAVAAEPR